MTPLHFFAQYHHGYGGGTVDWLTHMVVSSVVHSLIYTAMFRMTHGLTLIQVRDRAGRCFRVGQGR